MTLGSHAASLTWNNGAATGNWNTTDLNWSGAATWNNATPDQAVFGATGVGTVNLTTAITANKLTFNTAGYTISGNSLTPGGTTPTLTANADATISSVLAGSATITKNGAGKLTLTGANTLTGTVAVTQGTVELGSGGTLVKGVTVSGAAGNNATFNLAGGAITSSGGSYTAGAATGETGIVNLSGGSLTLSGGAELTIGNATNAITSYNQTGGAVSVTTTNHIYTGMGTGTGVTTNVNLSGGGFTVVPGNSSTTFSIGGRSLTTVTVSGSAVVDSYQTRFGWGADLSATDGGTLNLNGGTWKTNRLYHDVTVLKSELNFNGGTLQARQATTAFITALGSANVMEGGAKIDSNTFDITIAQPLLHGGTAPIDGGLAKSGAGTLYLAGSHTFTGPVNVTGGTLELDGTLPATVAITASNSEFVFSAPGQTAASVSVGAGGTLQVASLAATTVNTLALGVTSADTCTLRLAVAGGSYVPLQATHITAVGSAGSISIDPSGGITGAGTYHLIACSNPIGGTGFAAFKLATTAAAGFTYALAQNSGYIDLVVTATPLPVVENDDVSVTLDPSFPQALQFGLKTSGAILLAGDPAASHAVVVNGTSYPASVTSFSQSGNQALYTLNVPGFNINIFYQFAVDGAVLTRTMTGLTGSGEPNVQTINLGTPLIRAGADQTGAAAAFVRNVDPNIYANYSGSMAGDTIGAVTDLATGSWDSTWCFVSTSQAVGTAYNNLFDYPFTVKVTTIGGVKCAAIYDRDYNYRFKDIKPGVWFQSKTFIAGDTNNNGVVDWQDGAEWIRAQLPPMLPALADHYARGGAWQQSSVGYLSDTSYSTVNTPYPLYASQMRMTFYQTEGVPQAIECAGWTYRGHDWMWSDWDQTVNPGGGGRAGYDAARASAANYNGNLSFHLNQDLSALECRHYDDSIMAKDANGNKLGHYAYCGQNFYDISHFLDLQRGTMVSRINGFLDLFAPSPLVVYLDQMWNHPSALNSGNGAEEQYAKAISVETFRDRGTSTTTEGYQCSLFRNGMLQCKYRNNNVSHIDDFVTAGKLMWQFVGGPTTEFSDAYYMMFGGRLSQEYRSGNIFGSSNWMGNVMMEDTYILTMMNACMRKYTPMEYVSDSAKYQVRWGSDMFATVDKTSQKFTLTQGNVTLADGTDRFLPNPDGSLKIHVYSMGGSYGRWWSLPPEWNGVTNVDRYELTECGRAFIDRLPVSNGRVRLSTPAKVPYILLPAAARLPAVGPVDSARGMSATASSVMGSDVAANAIDGDDTTCWSAATGTGAWLAIDLGRETEINRIEIREVGNDISAFRIQIGSNGTWADVASGTTVGASLRKVFPNVRSSMLRLCIDSTRGGVRIASLEIHADANLAMTATASASSNSGSGWGDNYVEGTLQWGRDIQAARAMDGAPETYWRPVSETAGAWLEADFSRSSKVSRVVLNESGNRVGGFKIQYWDGSANWLDAYTGTTIGGVCEINFAEVATSKVRLWVTAASATPMISEFAIFDVGGIIPVVTPPTDFALGGVAVQSSTYSVSGAPQVASRAIDGNTDGDWNHNSVSCTANGSLGWWEVDLLSPKTIAQVNVWWRYTPSTRDRNVDLVIYDTANPATRAEVRRIQVTGNAIPSQSTTINLATPVRGQVVRLEHTPLTDVTDPYDAELCLAEVQVYGIPGGFDNWAEDQGLSSSNNQPEQDADGDGSCNLLEFALGGDPLSPTDRGVCRQVRLAGGDNAGVVLTLATLVGAAFTCGQNGTLVATLNGISYEIEGSTDLVAWNVDITEVAAATDGLPAAPAGYEYHSFTASGMAGTPPEVFMRVRVSGS